MYILYKLEKRAETTDTLLFFVAKERSVLEEIILSLYDELVEREIEWAYKECAMNDETIDIKNLEQWCRMRMKAYDIIYVPYVD